MPDFIGNKFFLLLKFTPIDTYLSLLSCCVTVGYQCDINVEVDYDLGDENGGAVKKITFVPLPAPWCRLTFCCC